MLYVLMMLGGILLVTSTITIILTVTLVYGVSWIDCSILITIIPVSPLNMYQLMIGRTLNRNEYENTHIYI